MSRTWTVALHFNIGYEVTLRILHGVIQYAQETSDLVLRDYNFSKEDLDLPQPPPWMGKADGLLMNLARLPGVHDWLLRSGVPTVNTGGDLAQEELVASVFTDPQSVARLAVGHFLDLGLRNFAFIGARESDATKRVHRALVKELGEHGFGIQTYGTEKLFMGTFEDFSTLEEVEPGLVEMLRDAPKPLALLVQTDRFAAAICRMVQLMGLRIPDDVAVIGIHDTEMARLCSPPISSIRPDHQKIGYEAAKLLHRMLRGEHVVRRKILLPALRLVERASTIQRERAKRTDAQKALDYIREHVAEGIRIYDVAAHVHIPMRTFQADFAAIVGLPVGEVIRRERLNLIETLLKTTTLPIERVARLSGLANAPSLIRILIKATGMSPVEYRKKHSGGG